MQGKCFLCGRFGATERHHIYGASNRRKSEKLGLVVNLCHECHNEPPNGVHHNAEAMRKLKKLGQEACMRDLGWSEEQFIKEFGRSYLDV